MKFFSSLAILIATSNVSKGENCPGTDFPSGTVVGKDNQKNFQRRGNNCPCSFAEAECFVTDNRTAYDSIIGKDCSLIEIDGILAAEKNDYPKIEVEYRWKVCNFNDELTIKFADDAQKSFFELSNNKEKSSGFKKEIADTVELKPSQCESFNMTDTIDTSISSHFISAQLSARPYINNDRLPSPSNCYAYAYTPIDIIYGQCNMTTNTICEVEVATDTGTVMKDCQEHVYSEDVCGDSNVTITYEACNNEDRDINISEKRSNVRSWEETKKRSTPVFGNVNETLAGNSCQTFIEKKVINTCKENYISINVKGKDFLLNAENPFLDKDCKSFAFEPVLPIDDTLPSATPSVSHMPSETPSISAMPSAMPSTVPSESAQPSGTPTASDKPSVSQMPSETPSISQLPSNMPSTTPTKSAQPSETPSVSQMPSETPSVSQMPSIKTSAEPSESAQPSETPSVSQMPSETPSVSQLPSAMPSTAPSESAQPSETPSVSQMPSETPSVSQMPSETPSVSQLPSVMPSTAPSETPSVSTKPSETPSVSSLPSAKPSESSQPSVSALPSSNPADPIVDTRTQSPSESTAPSIAPTKPIPGGVKTPPPSISTAPSSAPTKSSKSKGKGKGKGKGKQTKTISPTESPSESPSEKAVKDKTKADDPNGLGEAIVSFSPSPHPFLASIIALVGMIFVL